jgi:FtsP/CotA-like multicopper oxidase with cupredoxin domain
MTTRREFLATAGRLGLGAAALGPGALVAPSSRAAGGPARTIHLEAREVAWELAPGQTIRAMAYNGRIPGPEIRAREGERLRGERLRLRLINASNEHTHVVAVGGHRLTVTHTDGNPLRAPVTVDAVPIAPERALRCPPHCRPPRRLVPPVHGARPCRGGERLATVYDAGAGRSPAPPDLDLDRARFWRYELGRGQDVLPAASGGARWFELTLGGGMGGGNIWTINGKVDPGTDPLPLRHGDRAQVLFRNMSPEAHPMHLHGQSFRVLAINGRRAPAPLVKDSVDVEAHASACTGGRAGTALTARARRG